MKKIPVLFLFAVAGWYIFGLPLLLTEAREKQAAALRIRLRSNVQSMIQVFFDQGRGIREEDSVSVSIFAEGEFADYRFAVPSTQVLAIRLDPTTTAGEIIIASASIVNNRGKTLHEFGLTDFVPMSQIKSLRREPDGLHVATDDPAPDPSLTLHLTNALDFSKRGQLSAKSWSTAVGCHTLTALLLLGISVGLGSFVRRRWGTNWLDFSLPADEEIEWIPVALYLYMTSVFGVLVVGVSCLEQMIFRMMP